MGGYILEIYKSLRVLQGNINYLYNYRNQRIFTSSKEMRIFVSNLIKEATVVFANDNKEKMEEILVRLFVRITAFINFLNSNQKNNDARFNIYCQLPFCAQSLNIKTVLTANWGLEEWQLALSKNTKHYNDGEVIELIQEIVDRSVSLSLLNHNVVVKFLCKIIIYIMILANNHGVNLYEAYDSRYLTGCPHCHHIPCCCGETVDD